MGDMTKEPSMEEILSSIKRIIAEDGDERAAPAARERRGRAAGSGRKTPAIELVDIDDGEDDAVLELTDEVADMRGAGFDTIIEEELVDDEPLPAEIAEAPDDSEIVLELEEFEVSPEEIEALEPVVPVAARAESKQAMGAKAVTDNIVSVESEVAARSSLASLSSLVVKPTASAGENTLEGLVRDMLRPMLQQWLDANLPKLVEGMVAKEIARITSQVG